MGGARRGATWGGRGATWGGRGATWGGRSARAARILLATSTAVAGTFGTAGLAGAQDATTDELAISGTEYAPISQFDLTVEPMVADSWVPPTISYDPAADPFSMDSTTALTGAEAWWNAGYTGAGVDVAVIDTGVSPVAGLTTPGKLIYGPDLSFESQAPNLAHLDTNGHGTFMAGLIAGKDTTLTTSYANAPASAYRGIAPDARIVSLKVGVANGAVDVSQVIAAINWVVEHRNDNGMNIRVLNLSYGTDSTQNSTVDPLSYAVEQAWKKGIVVVAAAGNSGYVAKRGLANPARNPYVLSVGGYDANGTALKSDDIIGTYSASAASSTDRRPDVVSVGSRLQGLRVPNSYIDATHPEGRLGDRYFRGSGTSEAAAITSGSVALLLQKHPSLTPDQVKRFFTERAKRPRGADQSYWGNGRVSLGDMISANPPTTAQTWSAATGTGSLELARGSAHLVHDDVTLAGEIDIFGKPYDSAAMAALQAAESSWAGGMWNGSTWTGSAWSSAGLLGSTWSGSTWSGSSWSGSTWSGSTWSGSTWSGSTWSGSTWSGSTWSGSTWSGSTWSGSTWSGSTWTSAWNG